MGKKILAFLMILSLLVGCVSALADESKTIYTSDFSKDEDGWYGRGAKSFRTAENTLKTIERQSSWNSPGRDFNLIEGGKYQLSVEVKQDDLDSANFMISIAHTAEGVETYENLAFGKAKKGEWVTLKGEYVAGPFERSVLYVENLAECLRLILDALRRENHYDHVEVCVKKEDAAAIRLYEKCGFFDSGYIDEDAPDSLNLICRLAARPDAD